MFVFALLACGTPATPDAGVTPNIPAVNVVIQARGEGEIEPCGCPKHPLGGLPRRNSIIHDLAATGPVVTVDGGGTLAPRIAIPDADMEQRRIKADLIAQAWKVVGIDAVAIAPTDWSLGRATIDALAHQYKLPILAANLECDEPYPGAVLVERGGLRIGIVGVTGGTVKGCTVSKAGPAAITALEALGPVDVTIGLVPLGGDALEEWKTNGPPVDLLVASQTEAAPRAVGRGWLVPTATRNQKLTVLGLFPAGARDWEPADRAATLREEVERMRAHADDSEAKVTASADEVAKQRLQRQADFYTGEEKKAKDELDAFQKANRPPHSTFTLTWRELSPDVVDHAATRDLVDAALGRISATEHVSLTPDAPHVAASGSAYAGSDACVACHPAESAQWGGTPHAHAWASLVATGRAVDRECTACHVTGMGQRGGPTGPADAAGLQDVQCEACHGPSAAHVRSSHVRTPLTPGVEVCTKCHDGERDMGQFAYDAYREKVVHAAPPTPMPAVAPPPAPAP